MTKNWCSIIPKLGVLRHGITKTKWLWDNRCIIWFRSTLLCVFYHFCSIVRFGLALFSRYLAKVCSIGHIRSCIDFVSSVRLLSTIKKSRYVHCKSHAGVKGHNRRGQVAHGNEATSNSLESNSLAESRQEDIELMIYLFEYDVSFWPLRDISALERELKAFPGWAQCFQKTWLIATHDTIDIVQQKLECHLQQRQDKLLVLSLGQYSGRLPREIWDWISYCRRMGY
jgi:hypothetical protein